MSFVIYEVNLIVSPKINKNFYAWLQQHIQDILKLPGFIDATLLTNQEAEKYNYTVWYKLTSHADLNNYFDNFAQKFRQDGLSKFPSGFSASRRVLTFEKFYGQQ